MLTVVNTDGCLKAWKEVLADKHCLTCIYFRVKEWKTGFYESCGRNAMCSADRWGGWKPYWLVVEEEIEL